MDAFARESAVERAAFFGEASARRGLPPHIIEKDFWVCWTLKRLFALEGWSENLLFKGGTSLSKAYGLIERFSEDIDLSIHRTRLGFGGEEDPANPEFSGKKRNKQNEALGEAAKAAVEGDLRSLVNQSMTDERLTDEWSLELDETDPEGQSLAFFYPRTSHTLSADHYLRPAVKIEFGARSDHWPAEKRTIVPYLEEALPGTLATSAVGIKTMSARRTFWEKATILHQMAHLPAKKALPIRYSRHYCDLAAMIEGGVGEDAGQADDLLAAVVAHKMTFYRAAWAKYEDATRGTLKLVPADDRIPDLSADLAAMKEMFFGDPPELDHVLEVLLRWQDSFNQENQ